MSIQQPKTTKGLQQQPISPTAQQAVNQSDISGGMKLTPNKNISQNANVSDLSQTAKAFNDMKQNYEGLINMMSSPNDQLSSSSNLDQNQISNKNLFQKQKSFDNSQTMINDISSNYLIDENAEIEIQQWNLMWTHLVSMISSFTNSNSNVRAYSTQQPKNGNERRAVLVDLVSKLCEDRASGGASSKLLEDYNKLKKKYLKNKKTLSKLRIQGENLLIEVNKNKELLNQHLNEFANNEDDQLNQKIKQLEILLRKQIERQTELLEYDEYGNFGNSKNKITRNQKFGHSKQKNHQIRINNNLEEEFEEVDENVVQNDRADLLQGRSRNGKQKNLTQSEVVLKDIENKITNHQKEQNLVIKKLSQNKNRKKTQKSRPIDLDEDFIDDSIQFQQNHRNRQTNIVQNKTINRKHQRKAKTQLIEDSFSESYDNDKDNNDDYDSNDDYDGNNDNSENDDNNDYDSFNEIENDVFNDDNLNEGKRGKGSNQTFNYANQKQKTAPKTQPLPKQRKVRNFIGNVDNEDDNNEIYENKKDFRAKNKIRENKMNKTPTKVEIRKDTETINERNRKAETQQKRIVQNNRSSKSKKHSNREDGDLEFRKQFGNNVNQLVSVTNHLKKDYRKLREALGNDSVTSDMSIEQLSKLHDSLLSAEHQFDVSSE